jgi:hypothetical protein
MSYTDECDVEVQVIVWIRNRATGRVLGKSCSRRGCGKGYLSEAGREMIASAGLGWTARELEKLVRGWSKNAADRGYQKSVERARQIRRRKGYE